jgi:1-deoxy-D-xylulose-5-phosphate reductoisomerase
MSHPGARRVIILGSTGSIGRQALDVIAHLNGLHERGQQPFRFAVVGLAAGRNAELLGAQARAWGVSDLALAEEGPDAGLMPGGARIRRGAASAERLVREVEADVVLAAMVGAAGLPATLAAVDLGRDVALANKETLVAAGALVVPAALRSGSRLLPVDSEHSGVWQCLQGVVRSSEFGVRSGGNYSPPVPADPLPSPNSELPTPTSIRRVILTASGGPFRTWTKDRIDAATPQEALRHPTWTMGRKVTIDSASLTNKALELIEAHWLFGLEADRLGALIHPQSIVHALIECADGSTIAQLGSPDMRSPIQYALTFPHRPVGCARLLDWTALSKLEFEVPDPERFPALALGYEAIRRGGVAGAVMNAANEEAVGAFLAGRSVGGRPMAFGMIPALTAAAIDELGAGPLTCLEDCLAADRRARAFVAARLAR